MHKTDGPRRQHSFSIRGFTIVELLIVIVVIGILAAITLVSYNGIQNRAKSASLQSDLAQAVKQLEVYKVGTSTSAQYPVDLATVNLKAGSGTTYTYYYNASNNNYCLQAVNAGISYSVSSIDTTPRAGDCTTNGLVGWWNFNGNANDSSGNNNDGTNNGATLTIGQNGQANSAYSFNGSSQYMALPSGFSSFNSGITFSIWAYPTTPASWARFFDLGNNSSSNNILLTRISTTNDIGYEVYNGSITGGRVYSSNAILNNAWHHYVVTQTAGGTVVLYRDGAALESSDATIIPPDVLRTKNYIGRSNWAADAYYQGSIDDVRIYNRALSATEVTALYTAGAQ